MRRWVAAAAIWLLSAAGAMAACPSVPNDCSNLAAKNLSVGTNATIGGTLGVSGIGTFSATGSALVLPSGSNASIAGTTTLSGGGTFTGTFAGAHTYSGAISMTSAGTALAVTNNITAAVLTASGTITAGNGSTVKTVITGGAGTAFVQSTGGSLTVQAASGFDTIIRPQSLNNVVNVKHQMRVDLFSIAGIPATQQGHIQGVHIAANDTLVAADGVWWFNVDGNLGAIPWTTGEVLAQTGQQRNSFGNIYTNTNTGTTGPTAPTGTGTVSDGTITWVYQSSDFVSNRVPSASAINVRSQTGPTTPNGQFQWSAQADTFQASSTQGGTAVDVAGNTRGTGYAGGDQAWLFPGALNWTAIVGRESDVGIFNAGNRAIASAGKRYGHIVASYGDDQGAIEDDAITFESRGTPWGTVLHLGEAVLQNGGSLTTRSILEYFPRPPGALTGSYVNPAAANGIELYNIRFATSALRGPSNTGIDNIGTLSFGAGSLKTNSGATAIEFDAPGSIATAVVWNQGANFIANDEIYDPAGSGLIIKINTVNGSGVPTSISILRPGGVLGATPSNPVLMFGGSGGTTATPPKVDVTWTAVPRLDIGTASATTLNIGRAASTTTFAGIVNVGTTGSAAIGIGNASNTTTVAGVINLGITGSAAIAVGNSGTTATMLGILNVGASGSAAVNIGNASNTVTVLGTINIGAAGSSPIAIGASGRTTTFAGTLVLPTSTTGAGTQTFTNSPCSGLTSERWIPVQITGQTGTWYVPACQ